MFLMDYSLSKVQVSCQTYVQMLNCHSIELVMPSSLV